MGYDIRPLSFGEVLDRAFRVLRDNFGLLFGVAAVLYIPMRILAAFGHIGGGIIALIYLLVVGPITYVALALAVANVYLDRPITIGGAYDGTRSIFGSIIATYFLWYLLLFVALVLLIVPGIYFATCWSVVVPVMIVERRFGMGALRRSRELVAGDWWRTLGITLVAALIVLVFSMALNVVWEFVPLLGPILSGATAAVGAAYSLVVIVVYYFDLRCRKEDFDLRRLAAQIRSEGGAAPAAPGASRLA